ncbi:MAG: phosphoenolpyruvate carboxykinase [Firmicutes bacterium]|nr:phosphoenolpyruvate carboxykinase [Bacillota bacterium]
MKRLDKEGSQFILHTDGMVCFSGERIAASEIFEEIVRRFVHRLQELDSPLLEKITQDLSNPQEVIKLASLLKILAEKPLEKAVEEIPGTESWVADRIILHHIVEGLYNYWRSFGRYMVCHQKNEQQDNGSFYREFNHTMEQLSSLIRALYRDICENITGEHPAVFRQVCAGCEVGLVVSDRKWNCPSEYKEKLEEIPFVRQVLLNPPLLINPPKNTRSGQFRRVGENPLSLFNPEKTKWICYPAKVGPLVVFVYFHQKFIGLGSSLANLFDLADEQQIAAGPDAIFFYGAPAEPMSLFGQLPTVFFDDLQNNILVGAVPDEDRFGYFGYLKKMILTLHNVTMMKTGRMPFHGAMVNIQLKNGSSANILLIGDTAAGKSESLEAFRILGKEHIRELKIIADDMGSLEVAEDGRVLGYGTEIGAFIRLDDLEFGYAFGQIDRAIIMSPHMVNARVVLPITTMEEILKGYPLDFILYANNYDQVDESHPIVEKFESVEDALNTFREGAAMSKGTTTSTGLTHSYFANIFGPTQYRELHEKLAENTFENAFRSGVFIGQLRTRLGISSFESTGPAEAAKALFLMISERKK